MNTRKERIGSFKTLGNDHHDGLMLCWKIRTGYRKYVEIDRIKSYTDWFYRNYLIPHFEIEEKHVFPILGNNHQFVKKALAEHRKLRRLFEDVDEISKTLGMIEERLDSLIRFEERILFQEIQRTASPTVLADMMERHADWTLQTNAMGTWEDEFWK